MKNINMEVTESTMKNYSGEGEYQDEDCIMNIEEFIEEVNHGGFTNDDGHGFYMKNGETFRDHPAIPSRIFHGDIDYNFTHVIWFNK